jgi:hypothetical protein
MFLARWRSLSLLLVALAGCRQPEVRVPAAFSFRLYDLAETRRLACDLAPLEPDGGQGTVRSATPGDESFKGEWVRLACRPGDAAVPGSSKYPSSLPLLPAQPSPLEAAWGWAADLGVDFSHLPRSYWSFFMYGDGGTRINGFFLDRDARQDEGVAAQVRLRFQREGTHRTARLMGAAQDNHGHRYRLIGNSKEGTMQITPTTSALRAVTPASAGAANRAAAVPRAVNGDAAAGPGTFQDQLDLTSQPTAQTGSTAASAQDSAQTGPADSEDQAAVQGTAGNGGGNLPASGAEPVSPVQVFTYGALGVDAPDGTSASQKSDYQAGEWTGAAVKVGGIIALLA